MKEKLRKEYLKLRRGYSSQDLDKKNILIRKNLESLKEFAESENMFFYISFENEAETHSLIKYALGKKKCVIIPYLDKKEIFLSKLNDFSELEKGAFGILEPKKELIRDVDIKNVDLIIVPGIVFDSEGHRIGFGEGCYDRLLKKSGALKIGLAFEFQIMGKIPVEEHDIPVDIIVTEERVIKIKK